MTPVPDVNPMPVPPAEAQVKLIHQRMFSGLLAKAEESPRRRTNYNFHKAMEENPHRFLNVMLRGTYIAPHRHLHPAKSESFVALEGKLGFFIFDEAGAVLETHILGEGGLLGIDIVPGIWHTIAVLSDHAVCFEVKPGPYNPTDDKEFAAWAPREGEPGVTAYLQQLELLLR